MLVDEQVEEVVEDLSLEDEIKAAMDGIGDVSDEPEEMVEEDIPEDTADDVDEEDEPAPEDLEAPEHWDEELTAAFDGIDSEAAKAAFLKKSNSMDKAFGDKNHKLSEQVKDYEKITELVAPWDAQIKSSGMTPYDAISNVMNAYQGLQQNPVAGVTQIINSLDKASQDAILKEFIQDGDTAEGYVDPEIQGLRDKLERLTGQVQQTNQYSVDNERARVNNQVELFRDAVGDDGKSLYPHFEAVESDMVSYIQQGHSLKDSYDKAIWANPDVRAKMIEDTAQQKNVARKRSATKAAKASRNVNTIDKSTNVEPERTLREELAYNMEKQRRS